MSFQIGKFPQYCLVAIGSVVAVTVGPCGVGFLGTISLACVERSRLGCCNFIAWSNSMKMRVLLLALLAVALAFSTVAAQSILLPPPFRPTLPRDQEILRLQLKPNPVAPTTPVGQSPAQTPPPNEFSGGTILVEGNQLILSRRDGRTEFIPLASRTINDVMQDLRSKYGELFDEISSSYVTLSAKYLDDEQPARTLSYPNGSPRPVLFVANSDAADVALDFGIVMAPSAGSTSTTTNTGLLSQAGFQLNAVGGILLKNPATGS